MLKRERKTLQKNEAHILRKQNVIGCGIGFKEVRSQPTNTTALLVFVKKKLPLSSLLKEDHVPTQVDSLPTDVIEVGDVRLFDSLRIKKERPAQPGISIGHYGISAGTFGAVVYDECTNQPLILSNNHVLANTTNGQDGRAYFGDPIVQPGTYDGGTLNDTIGYLWRYSPIIPMFEQGAQRCKAGHHTQSTVSLHEKTCQQTHFIRNKIDAALAIPSKKHIITTDVFGLGSIVGTTSPTVRQTVWKSGRSSNVTQGTVRALHVTLAVAMGVNTQALFVDQIVTSPMAEPGDSGSIGLTGDGEVFGLLFAGSDEATIYNPIQHVTSLLNVRFVPL